MINKDCTTELLLIRHGEDEQDKLGGWSDNHLTNNGIKQVEELAVKLKESDIKYDLILSGCLVRAKETAKIINDKLNLEVIYNQNFNEINNGDLKNLTKEEFMIKYPDLYYSSLMMDEKYPSGESPLDFYRRVKDEIYSILLLYNHKNIILVTHGGVIGIILSILKNETWNNQVKSNVKYACTVSIKIISGIVNIFS
jgi:probable phosphoglycerate mutase